MEANPKIIRLFQDLADHTAPECANVCRAPHTCCELLYCGMAADWAMTQYGIELKPTGHPTLPFMSENGCVVPPYLRPICTLHTCAINSFGVKPGDPDWTKKYFKLRDAIEREMAK